MIRWEFVKQKFFVPSYDATYHNEELISAVEPVAADATAVAAPGFDLDDVVVNSLPAAGLTARTGFFATTCDCAFNKFWAFICVNCASEI